MFNPFLNSGQPARRQARKKIAWWGARSLWSRITWYTRTASFCLWNFEVFFRLFWICKSNSIELAIISWLTDQKRSIDNWRRSFQSVAGLLIYLTATVEYFSSRYSLSYWFIGRRCGVHLSDLALRTLEGLVFQDRKPSLPQSPLSAAFIHSYPILQEVLRSVIC